MEYAPKSEKVVQKDGVDMDADLMVDLLELQIYGAQSCKVRTVQS